MYCFVQPSEQNAYADIEAAYTVLEESYGAKQEDIILMVSLLEVGLLWILQPVCLN